jgi:hypothetical protein
MLPSRLQLQWLINCTQSDLHTLHFHLAVLGRLALFIHVSMQAQNRVWRSPTSQLEFANCGEKLSDYLGRSMYGLMVLLLFLHKKLVINQLVDVRHKGSRDSYNIVKGWNYSVFYNIFYIGGTPILKWGIEGKTPNTVGICWLYSMYYEDTREFQILYLQDICW